MLVTPTLPGSQAPPSTRISYCPASSRKFRVSVLDLPRMEDKLLQGTEDFLASARMLQSALQPDLAIRLPVIFTGLKNRTDHSSDV
jgi:hypothetical protein